MFSLGYLPSAERLTVVILKARHLRCSEDSKSLPSKYIVGRYVLKPCTSSVFLHCISFSVQYTGTAQTLFQ